MEKLPERVNALEAFKKAIAKADTSQKKGSRFLGKGPAAKYGSSVGQSSWHPYSREEACRGRKQVHQPNRGGASTTYRGSYKPKAGRGRK